VKLGYVQVIEVILVPAVSATIWSGAELVTTSLFSLAQLHSATLIPVHAIILSATYHAVGSQASYFTFSSVPHQLPVYAIVSFSFQAQLAVKDISVQATSLFHKKSSVVSTLDTFTLLVPHQPPQLIDEPSAFTITNQFFVGSQAIGTTDTWIGLVLSPLVIAFDTISLAIVFFYILNRCSIRITDH
jgi:hypothetical protein